LLRAVTKNQPENRISKRRDADAPLASATGGRNFVTGSGQATPGRHGACGAEEAGVETTPVGAVAAALAHVSRIVWAERAVSGSLDDWHPEHTNVLVLSYRSAFEFLWRFDQAFLDWLRAPNVMVLVWDETPPDTGQPSTIRTRDYVTALDWAAACAMAVSRAHQSSPASLIVVDLASAQQPSADAVKLLPRLQDSTCPVVPWLHILPATLMPSLLTQVLRSAVAPAAHASFTGLLSQLWTRALGDPAKPGDRHAIANLVGPRVLLGALEPGATPVAAPTRHVTALDAQLKLLGIMAAPADDPLPPLGRLVWEEQFDTVVLIDDMADHGWSDVLSRLLDLNAGEIVVVQQVDTDQAFGPAQNQSLLAFLKASFAEDTSTIFDHPLTGARPLVFLDLRLFAHYDAELRRAFVRDLLAVAESANRCRLPADAIPHSDLDDIRAWLDDAHDVEGPGDRLVLTLLPRLLALASPLTPFVIFSTATHRLMFNKLEPYPNLILEFEKPVFFSGDFDAAIARTHRLFATAVSRASRFARAARTCRSAASASAHALVVDRSLPVLEVYVDESEPRDRQHMSVGGLLVEYPSPAAAVAFSGRLRRENLVWGADRDTPGEPQPTRHLAKASAPHSDGIRREVLRRIDELARNDDIRVAAFSLRAQIAGERDPSSWQSPDAVYRTLLAQSIEAILFEWLAGRETPPQHIHLFVATRRLAESTTSLLQWQVQFGTSIGTVADPDASRARLLETATAYEHWRCDPLSLGAFRVARQDRYVTIPPNTSNDDVRIRAYSFSSDDVLPIVTDVFWRRGRDLPVKQAVGVTLSYYKTPSSSCKEERSIPLLYQLPRQMHYAADWAVSRPHLVPKTWWMAGLQDDTSKRTFQTAMRCSRLLDEPSRIAEALYQWSKMDKGPVGLRSLRRYVKARLASRVSALRTSDVDRLAELLEQVT
jgi:hypothetical protein